MSRSNQFALWPGSESALSFQSFDLKAGVQSKPALSPTVSRLFFRASADNASTSLPCRARPRSTTSPRESAARSRSGSSRRSSATELQWCCSMWGLHSTPTIGRFASSVRSLPITCCCTGFGGSAVCALHACCLKSPVSRCAADTSISCRGRPVQRAKCASHCRATSHSARRLLTAASSSSSAGDGVLCSPILPARSLSSTHAARRSWHRDHSLSTAARPSARSSGPAIGRASAGLVSLSCTSMGVSSTWTARSKKASVRPSGPHSSRSPSNPASSNSKLARSADPNSWSSPSSLLSTLMRRTSPGSYGIHSPWWPQTG
mmetsp:Transcript_110112/g.312304  ORF Transcript_110112/g.312304 Transcript_110112/m.312304 type:complete len:319 (+) Transcript_110112:168-1124(+)